MRQAEVERLKKELDAALADRDAATERLKLAEKRRQVFEKAACYQLTKTEVALKQTGQNLRKYQKSVAGKLPQLE
jgi:hypothetical protein